MAEGWGFGYDRVGKGAVGCEESGDDGVDGVKRKVGQWTGERRNREGDFKVVVS